MRSLLSVECTLGVARMGNTEMRIMYIMLNLVSGCNTCHTPFLLHELLSPDRRCANRVLSGTSPSSTRKPLYSGRFSTPNALIQQDLSTKCVEKFLRH